MQQDFNDIIVLFPEVFNLEKFRKLAAMEPFEESTIDFLNELSRILSKDARTRSYPDVATFAFFCRKANILKIKEQYKIRTRLGRGVVFHIAPSNVPVNFAYSLVCGMLAGNINIIKVSSKEFEQVTIICDAIAKMAESGSYKETVDKIFIVRYDRQSKATTLFSSLCDVRVIWGGDETITQIRSNPIQVRSFDVTFADRYSLCVINADEYCNEPNPEAVAFGFYNDTYLFDQNACTAPHLILWMGEETNIEKSKIIFWNALYKLVKEKIDIQPVIAVDKLTSLYSGAVRLEDMHKISSDDNLLWRIDLKTLPANIDEFRCSSGYFTEHTIQSLSELRTVVNRKYQTLSYYGFPQSVFEDFIKEVKPVGIDRIVPVGRTMDFSVVWDGFDLIETLSRKITII
jgi:hypothetical protein